MQSSRNTKRTGGEAGICLNAFPRKLFDVYADNQIKREALDARSPAEAHSRSSSDDPFTSPPGLAKQQSRARNCSNAECAGIETEARPRTYEDAGVDHRYLEMSPQSCSGFP
jgi:hypothetical protein